MAVFSYVGGSVSMATGGYGNLAIRKGAQVAAPNTITTSARSFIEGTPATGLFDGVDRSFLYSRITFTSGFSANKLNFNTTEPYNNKAYSSSTYYTPFETVFDDLDYSDYNTSTSSGEYWAHAYGYTNAEFGTAIAVDKERNAWVVGNTDFSGATITSITASLTATASFTNSTTTPTVGTNDSGYFAPWGALPFEHNIFRMNQTGSLIAVVSNSWITFDGAINNTLTSFTGTSPSWANLQIAAGQNSCQRIYWGTFGTAPTRTFRIRFEGTNATTGTLGSPNMVWEFILYESNPNIFDIQIGTLNEPSPRFSGISAGSGYYGTFSPTANSGYRFLTTNVHIGAAANNITVVKYNTKGQFQRSKDFPPYTGSDDLSVLSIGRNGPDVGESIKVGSDGRIYILFTTNSVGYVSGAASADFGIIKIDPGLFFKESSGASAGTVWAKTFGTTSADSGQSLDIDSNDNLYVTGFTTGSGQGGNDVFALKIDKNANILWKRTYGAVSGDLGNAVKVSPDGSVYIWGYSGSTPLVGTTDYFLLKINGSTGALVWQKHFNISATTGAQVFENSIDVDPSGNVYVNGYSATNPDGYFVAKIDPDGNFKWSRNVGAITANPDAGTSIKYKNGFIYVAGQDSSTTNNAEGLGLGVSKINADTGQLISNYVVGGVSTEFAYAIDIDDYNDIYATGAVSTSMTGLTSATGTNALVTKFILDTPQGGFTVSGDARVWSSTTAKRYTTSRQAFTAEDIAFQNDLIATGQQFIFVGTTSETQTKFEKEFRFTGSGSLPALTSTLEQTPIQTTQYLQRTNVLSDSTEYFRTNFSSLLQVSNVVNPITGVLETPSSIYNGVSSSGGGVFPAYLTPVSNTGVFASNTKVVLSIFAKANNFNKFRLLAYADRFGSSGALPNIEVEFNLTTGVATNIQATNAPLAYGIIPYEDGWYRCYFIVNLRVSSDQSGGSGWFQIRYTPDSVVGSSVYFYGPQVQKDVLTSYVENTSSVSSLTTTAFIEDDNVNTESTFDSPVTTPSIQLFTLSGTSTITYKNALNKPVQTYRGSSDLSLLNGYEVVFDPDLYTGKVQYKVYDSNLYSTEKFEKEFRFSGSGLIASSGINVIADVTFKGGVGAPGTQLFTIGSGYTNDKFIKEYVSNYSRNLFANPESLEFPIWQKNSTTVLQNPNLAPDNTQSADLLVGNLNATGRQSIRQDVNVVSGTRYTFSVFLKALGRRYATIWFDHPSSELLDGAYIGAGNVIDLQTGNVITPTAVVVKTIPYPNGWYRVYVSATPTFTGSLRLQIGIGTPNNLNESSVYDPYKSIGDGSSGIYVWGTQFEASSTLSPYVSQAGRVFSEGSGTNITASGDAGIKAPNRFIGSSPVEYYNPSQVAFGDGENFRASEFKADATAFYRFQKGAFSATGSIASGDTAFKSTTRVAFIPLNTLLLFNTNVFTKLAMRYAGKSPTTPFGGLEIVFEELEANAPPQQFKYSGAASEPTKAFRWVATPSAITITGTAVEKSIDAYAVSGQLTTGLQASAKVTFRPFDATDSEQLFSINGQHGTRVFVPNWRSVGTISITGEATQPLRNYSWVGSSPIQYFDPQEVVFEDGENFRASEFKYDSTALYRFQKATFSGTGFITTDPNASASVSFNPPDTAAGIQLFNISGEYSNLRFTKKSSEASGNISITGTITPPPEVNSWVGSSPIQYFDPDDIVFGEGDNFRASEFKYDSTALYRFQKGTFGGTGSITTDPNASAAVVFNPPDQISLFYFEGSYSDLKSTSRNVIITAPLFTGASGSATVTFNPPEFDPLFAITGSLVEKYTKGLYTGDGYINSSDFGSAKVTFRPFDATDSDPLFSINGQHGTRVFVPNWRSVGTIAITGEASQPAKNYSWIGSSPIQYFDPDDIVFGEGENFRASEFKYDSTALYRFQNANFNASGFITTDPNASAAVVFNPPDTAAGIQLFNVTGAYSDLRFTKKVPPDASALVVTISGAASDEKHIDVATGSGSTSITGTLVEKQTEVASGSGFLFSASGAAEAFGVNPVDTTQLFDISGSYSNLRSTFDPAPFSGTISITGGFSNVDQSFSWVGSSPTAYYNPYNIVFGEDENGIPTEYRNISTANYRNQFVESGSGFLPSISGSAAEIYKAGPFAAGGQITISGDATNIQFISQAGETPVLFQISGAAAQPSIQYAWIGLSPFTYFSGGQIVFEDGENFGASEFKCDSTAAYRFQNATFAGSGSITTDPNASAAVVFNPPDTAAAIQLFTVSGQHGTRVFVPNWIATGSITLSGSGTQNRQFGNFTGNSPSAYIDPYEIVFGEEENYGSTEIALSGYSRFSATPRGEVGSGALFTGGFFSNLKASFRPFDATDSEQLFSINGQHGTRVFVPNWRSTGSLSTGFEGSVEVTFNPPEFDPLFTTSGAAVDKHIDVASGSGNLFTLSGAAEKVTFRPVDATDTDFLFSITGAAGVKLRDYVWVSAVVEYDPYEYVINDEFIIPDFIKLKGTFVWDNVNNIYRSLTTESITRDITSGFAGASLVSQDIQGFLGATIPDGTGLDIPLETVSGTGSGATASYLASGNQIIFIQILSGGNGYTQGSVLRLPVGSNPTIVLGNLFNAPAVSAAIIQGNVGTRTFVPNWRGSGFISITGDVTDKHIDDATGSGNLFAASGASQSIGVNPPDDISLFVNVSGSAIEKHIDITSGSGSATFSGTVVEKQTEVALAGSGEAVFGDGSATIQIIRYSAFGGVISFSNTSTAAVTFNPPEADPLFLISGSASQSETNITSGSGSIATDISAVSRVVFNPADTEQLFEVTGTYSNLKFTSDYNGTGSVAITGTVVEKHIDAASGSGSSTITGAATESQTDIAVPGTGTIQISGEAVDEYASGGLRGSGTLFIIDGGSARVTFNPPEGNQLFDVSGSFSDIKITSDYAGTGSATLEGTLVSRIFVPNWIGSGTINVTGESTQKHIDITSGSGALFTDGFYSNLKATFRSVSAVGLFDVTGTAVEKQTEVAIASGSVTFTGSASDSQTDIASGSGVLFSGGFFSNLKATFRPFDATDIDSLFDITGSVSQKQTSKESGSGSIALAGTLVEKHIDAVTGSGSIASGLNASASVTFRPFDATDTDALFTILGSAIEKNTESYVGTGTATFSGTATESQRNITSGSGTLFSGGFFSNLKATFRPFDATDLDPLFSINGSASEKNTESYVGTGTATFSGTVVEKHIDIASGSGTLFSASGAAEAFSVNALEDVALFDISGAASQRYFAINIGSGSITTSFGGTASVTFNPPEFDPLFAVSGSYSNLKFISANVVSGTATFSGTVVEKFTDAFVGSGTATFSGTAVEKQTDITSGSGSLFTTSGASESVGVNPPDDVALFAISGSYSNLKFISANNVSGTATFSGTAVEKQIEVAAGSGSATFSGTALENQTDITSGSGSLFTASGASESIGVNPPDDIALFNISGTYSNFKFTSAWVGTGTLFAVSGAAESVTFNPPDSNQLFDVSGSVAQSQTNITSGSGSLFTAFGGTASVTFNPPEGNQLFDVSGTYSDLKFISVNVASGSATFSGTVVEKFASANVVSGTAEFSGTAVESQTDITSGSGSLFTASGAAEAFGANPQEDTALFDISGTYSDLKSTNVYVGFGSLFTFSGAVVVAAISEVGTGLFSISDTAIESTTYKSIDGTGSLFGFGGGVESVTFNPVDTTQLFELSGDAYVTGSFGYAGGAVDITGSGQATFRRALVPQVGSGEIVSSGESTNNKAFAPFVGSGSLFSASGSAQATTNVPPIDPIIWEDDLRTTLYLASGSASVSRAVSIDNDVNINISGSVVVRTLLPERVFATII